MLWAARKTQKTVHRSQHCPLPAADTRCTAFTACIFIGHSSEPTAGGTTASQPGTDLNTLLIDPASVPAPYDALVLPQQAISQETATAITVCIMDAEHFWAGIEYWTSQAVRNVEKITKDERKKADIAFEEKCRKEFLAGSA